MDKRPTRITAKLTKLCRDPTDEAQRPESLPTGFSRYLIAKHWRGLSPGSLTAEDVAVSDARHGVEAILRHRIIAAPRGRGRSLQYLVHWEGAPDTVVDSWEDADLLDACPMALREYWATLSAAAEQRPDYVIVGAGTEVVAQQLRKVQKQRGVGGTLATCGRSVYTLPTSACAVTAAPSAAVLASAAIKGMQLLAVYKYTDGDNSYLQWCEGEVMGLAAPPRKGRRTGPRAHRVFWVEDGTYRQQQLSTAKYSTDAAAPEGSWFLFGSREQVAALAQA